MRPGTKDGVGSAVTARKGTPGQHATTVLGRLLLKEEYRLERIRLFPSKGSFDWFARQHREQIYSRKAMLVLGGRIFIDPERFDQFILSTNAPGSGRTADR